jgi:hypothetical protein
MLITDDQRIRILSSEIPGGSGTKTRAIFALLKDGQRVSAFRRDAIAAGVRDAFGYLRRAVGKGYIALDQM